MRRIGRWIKGDPDHFGTEVLEPGSQPRTFEAGVTGNKDGLAIEFMPTVH
jgi:hypothetical protein